MNVVNLIKKVVFVCCEFNTVTNVNFLQSSKKAVAMSGDANVPRLPWHRSSCDPACAAVEDEVVGSIEYRDFKAYFRDREDSERSVQLHAQGRFVCSNSLLDQRAKLIEEAAAVPSLKMVDLGLGAEEYKERFENQTRKTLYVTLKTSIAKHVKEIVRYRTTEIIKASPRLEAGARKVVARLRQLKESDKS